MSCWLLVLYLFGFSAFAGSTVPESSRTESVGMYPDAMPFWWCPGAYSDPGPHHTAALRALNRLAIVFGTTFYDEPRCIARHHLHLEYRRVTFDALYMLYGECVTERSPPSAAIQIRRLDAIREGRQAYLAWAEEFDGPREHLWENNPLFHGLERLIAVIDESKGRASIRKRQRLCS